MIAVHKQKTRDRVDYIRDTMIGAQGLPKDIKACIKELEAAIGDKPSPNATTGNDGQAFLAKNPKMRAGSKSKTPQRKKG